MHAEVQNLFIRIHLLSQAQENNLKIYDMLPELERQGYKIGEREVKLEMEKLNQLNFLTSHGDEYSMTGLGIAEFKDIKKMLKELCDEVLDISDQDKTTSTKA
ncbi:repressor of nif and glnA expression [Paenibacillus sp. DS2015]|uniref:hypothetical protein n=1 Tax=Paenibacillus sp. DS2015 TaxID=3373917 RepID=UPI003D23F350